MDFGGAADNHEYHHENILFGFYLHGIRRSAGRDRRDPRRNSFRFPAARSDRSWNFANRRGSLGEKTGNQVTIVSTPNSATARLAHQQWLAAGASGCRCSRSTSSGPVFWVNTSSISNPTPTVSKRAFSRPGAKRHPRRQTGRHAWFIDAGLLYLPQGSVGEAWRATAENWGTNGNGKNPGRRARRRQTTKCGDSSGRAGPTRA